MPPMALMLASLWPPLPMASDDVLLVLLPEADASARAVPLLPLHAPPPVPPFWPALPLVPVPEVIPPLAPPGELPVVTQFSGFPFSCEAPEDEPPAAIAGLWVEASPPSPPALDASLPPVEPLLEPPPAPPAPLAPPAVVPAAPELPPALPWFSGPAPLPAPPPGLPPPPPTPALAVTL